MIYLKEININDVEKEYEAITNILPYENGFTNEYYNSSKTEFVRDIIPTLIDHSKGINLRKDYVPDTQFFLWDDEKIVGLFRIRHYLNDTLKVGAGHIGYTILKKYRGRGYATIGLNLAIEKCEEIIKEKEIYLRVKKSNPASLKVQVKRGAIIVNEDDEYFYTRIKLKKGD